MLWAEGVLRGEAGGGSLPTKYLLPQDTQETVMDGRELGLKEPTLVRRPAKLVLERLEANPWAGLQEVLEALLEEVSHLDVPSSAQESPEERLSGYVSARLKRRQPAGRYIFGEGSEEGVHLTPRISQNHLPGYSRVG